MEAPENTERTFTDRDVKLLRLHTFLGDFRHGERISWLNPVEVLSGERRIGWASLSAEGLWADQARGLPAGSRIVADLVLDYATPERLEIENHDGLRLFARLEGVNDLAVEPFQTVGPWHALLPAFLACDVLGLQISTDPGYEDQPALGEVLL